MRAFKVGDHVIGDWVDGIIIDIEDDAALVEFDTGCGGGCLHFELSELKHTTGAASMIGQLCYDLYKVDWERSHNITAERKMSSIKNYYASLEEENYNGYSYEDYLNEFGYDGELYASFSEFFNTEYLDRDYICKLLGDEELITMYLEDVSYETQGI